MISSFKDLSKFFGCSVLTIYDYRKEIEDLLQKNYITNECSYDEKSIGTYNQLKLSKTLLYFVSNNKKINPSSLITLPPDLIQIVRKLSLKIGNPCITYEEKEFITKLEENTNNFKFFNEIKEIIPDIKLRMFFYNCCLSFLWGDKSLLRTEIDCIYNNSERLLFASSFLYETNPLLTNHLLEFTKKDKLNNSEIDLTPKAKKLLLGENLKLFFDSDKSFSSTIEK